MTDGQSARPQRLFALVPVRSLEGAKSRLGEALDPEERRDLVVALLERTIRALAGARRVERTIVVSRDEAALEVARAEGALALRQTGGGLNAALDQARETALDLGADGVAVVPADLPGLSARAVDEVAGALPEAGDAVVLVADRHGVGTNLLILRPPAVIPFAFGVDSRTVHAELAARAGASFREVESPLELDVDTPDDLVAAEGQAGTTLGHW